MEFELPTIPAGVILVMGVLSPYLIAFMNNPKLSPGAKRLISVLGSVALSGLSMGVYYAMSGDPVPEIVPLLLLGVIVSQAAYALIAKPLGAKAIEHAVYSAKPRHTEP